VTNRILFVTGTDTGVGKTVVATWLAATLVPENRVSLTKPFQTGALDPAVDGDEAFYRTVLGDEDATIRTFVSLPEPLAPSIAAERVGMRIEVESILAESRTLANKSDITIVEGAGGLLVPITADYDMANFAADLEASLVVVVRPSLGTLNHTALTIDAAKSRGLSIEMIVVSGFPRDAGVVEWENLRYLGDNYPETPLVVLEKAPLDAADPLVGLAPRLLGPFPPVLEGFVQLPLLNLPS
tara:strand:+ start:5370 stop:6092 length:723 start_codon:yes stop_codon:yes gene_type:complete